MVAWSGTPVLCTLFQQPLLSCPFCTNMYDFLPTFNNEAHLNLSEIYFFLTISNQVNQSIHKMCVVNFSEQRAPVIDERPKSPIEKRNLKFYSPVSREERETENSFPQYREENEKSKRIFSTFERRKRNGYSILKLQEEKEKVKTTSPFSRREREILNAVPQF